MDWTIGGGWSWSPPNPLGLGNTAINAVLLSCPSASAGFILQQDSDLTTSNWTRVDLGVGDDGTTQSVIVAPAAGHRFFRLKYP